MSRMEKIITARLALLGTVLSLVAGGAGAAANKALESAEVMRTAQAVVVLQREREEIEKSLQIYRAETSLSIQALQIELRHHSEAFNRIERHLGTRR